MNTDIDRLKAKETVRPAQTTTFINEAQAIVGTEHTEIMKLHALLEGLISSNAKLSTINEQLDETFIPEELEEEYEIALGYSEWAAAQITRIRCSIEMLVPVVASCATTWRQ